MAIYQGKTACEEVEEVRANRRGAALEEATKERENKRGEERKRRELHRDIAC